MDFSRPRFLLGECKLAWENYKGHMNLSIVHNDIDLTLKMDNFTSPLETIDLVTGEIFVGYFKPIQNIYVEMEARETDDNLVIQYFNGSGFTDLEKFEDRTFGLTESGLVSWEEFPQAKTTIKGKEAYWLKLTTKTPAPVEIVAINLVLSWDEDFGFIPGIMEYLPTNQASFIGFHQEARNRIIQYIRNSGKVIKDHAKLITKQVDQFDLLQISEFKQASKYMALHLIFDDLLKSGDDRYAVRSDRYFQSYEESLNSRLVSIDLDNDGKKDRSEMNRIQSARIVRE